MDLFGSGERRPMAQPRERWSIGGGGELSLFVGELVEAPAEVLCTSTNPKLSLLGGTGAAVIESAGWAVRQEALAIVQGAEAATGRPGLDVGTVHRTSAGRLGHAFLLHCVASGHGHAASAEAIRSCVRAAVAEVEQAGRASVALPVLGAGHASFPFEEAVRAIGEELRAASTAMAVVLVVLDPDRVNAVRQILDGILPRRRPPRPA